MTLSFRAIRCSFAAVLRALAEAVGSGWATHRRLLQEHELYRGLVLLVCQLLLDQLQPAIAWRTLLRLLDDLIDRMTD